jgi:hypothetical protein
MLFKEHYFPKEFSTKIIRRSLLKSECKLEITRKNDLPHLNDSRDFDAWKIKFNY